MLTLLLVNLHKKALKFFLSYILKFYCIYTCSQLILINFAGQDPINIKETVNYKIDNEGNIQLLQKDTLVAFPLYTSFFKRIIFKKILLYNDSLLYLETDNKEIFYFDHISKGFGVLENKDILQYDSVNLSWIFFMYKFKDFIPESYLYRKWFNLKQKFIAAKITAQNYCNRKIDSFMTYVLSFLEKNIHESSMTLETKTILLSLLRITKM